MTVPIETNKDLLTYNGTVGPFTYTFTLQRAADMVVYSNGVILSSGTYSVAPTGGVFPATGGTVTFNSLAVSPANLSSGILSRLVDYKQSTNLQIEGRTSAKTFENMVDKVTMAVQQAVEVINRSLHLPLTTVISAAIPDPTADQDVIYYDAVTQTFKFASVLALQAGAGAGNGNVVGPGSAATNGLMLYADATGKVAKYPGYTMPATAGATGEFLKFQAGNVVSGSLGLTTLRSSVITANGRVPPTSGAWSGTYVIFGDFTCTGTVTMASGTRVYCTGVLTFLDLVISNGVVGGNTDGATAYATQHAGPGAGYSPGLANLGVASQVVGGSGGGFGGAGGRGSADTAGKFAHEGKAYSIYQIFASSSGGAGTSDSSAGNGGKGGDAGGVAYIESLLDILFTGNVTFTGGVGGTGVAAGFESGGGGGAGGGLVFRAGRNGALSATKTMNGSGGAGGSGSSASYGKGGGGGGGILDGHCGNTWTESGTVTILGGALGTTGITTAPGTASGAGVKNILQGTYPMSFI